MRGVAHPERLRTGGTVGQRDVAVQDLLLGRIIEPHILLQVRLHDAQMHAVDHPRRGANEPQRAEAAQAGEDGGAEDERQPGPTSFSAIVSKCGRAGEDDNGDEGQAPDADNRGALRQRQRRGQRIAKGVPGKTRQNMTAQPFGRRQRHAQSQNARRPARPQQARQRKAKRGEDRQHCRQAEDRDRQQPAKGRRIDQEGIANPIKAGEKIAEAEPPARYRGTDDAVPTACSGAVNQPDQGSGK